jgi:hypothetical protein
MRGKKGCVGQGRTRSTTWGGFALVAAVGLMLGGCYGPESRIDPITPIAGNAIAHNKAVQVVDPWPDHAFRRHQVTDGERVRQAYESYRGTGSGGGDDGGGAVSGKEEPTTAGSNKPGA